MLKKLFILSLIAICLGCQKNQNKGVCSAQVCTLSYASITIKFADKNGNGIAVQNYSATNQRTHLKLIDNSGMVADRLPGYYGVANDSMRDQLSAEGDDILVTGTNPATGQTKTAVLKISGGCNCHVAKLSGVETITFD